MVSRIGNAIGHGCGFLLSAPVALIAEPIFAIKVIYNLAMEKYFSFKIKQNLPNYYSETLVANSTLLNHTYTDETKFCGAHLRSLNFEKKRIENKESLKRTLSHMKGTAKCLIPLIGYIWFVKTGEMAKFKADNNFNYINRNIIDRIIQQTETRAFADLQILIKEVREDAQKMSKGSVGTWRTNRPDLFFDDLESTLP
jgi:hypothetical protein